jgi:hypothetical protein
MSASRRLAAGLVTAGLVVVVLGSLPGGAATAAPGNNGTVKIENADVDSIDDANEANHPHVACPFAIRWYGFDEGTQDAVVAFAGQEPSGTDAVAALEGATALSFTGGAGGDVLNHTEIYRLDTSGLVAQDVQGFHVKVTVTTTSSLGNDTKSKVFWLGPCASPSPSPTPTVSETPSETPTPSESATETPSVLPTELTQTPSITPSVLGVKIVKRLPFTGSPSVRLLAFGASLVLAGAAIAMAGRTRGAHQH